MPVSVTFIVSVPLPPVPNPVKPVSTCEPLTSDTLAACPPCVAVSVAVLPLYITLPSSSSVLNDNAAGDTCTSKTSESSGAGVHSSVAVSPFTSFIQ